jgi:mRNA interferase MazF
VKVEYGQIWFADLDPTRYNEQAGKRPVLIASGGVLNDLPIQHAYIVPVTTRNRRLLNHVEVSGSGLVRRSWAMPEALRSVSTARFVKCLGWASPETMAEVDQWIGYFARPVD